MSDERVLDVFSILTSIPLPEAEPSEPVPLSKMGGKSVSAMSLLKYFDDKQKAPIRLKTDDLEQVSEQIQFTDFDISFSLNGNATSRSNHYNFFLMGLLLELSIIFDRDNQDGSCETFATPTGEYASSQIAEPPTVVLDDLEEHCSKNNENSPRVLSCIVKQVELNLVQKTYEMKVDIR